jgi:hypothetical protein
MEKDSQQRQKKIVDDSRRYSRESLVARSRCQLDPSTEGQDGEMVVDRTRRPGASHAFGHLLRVSFPFPFAKVVPHPTIREILLQLGLLFSLRGEDSRNPVASLLAHRLARPVKKAGKGGWYRERRRTEKRKGNGARKPRKRQGEARDQNVCKERND